MNSKILNLTLGARNEEVEKALLNVCTKNKQLTNFIKDFFQKYKEYEICAWEDYGWNWDIECFGDDETEVAICNVDFIDTEFDGWELKSAPEEYSKYLSDFDWNKIELDNGKYLLLTIESDYFSFQIFDKKTMMNGTVDSLYFQG